MNQDFTFIAKNMILCNHHFIGKVQTSTRDRSCLLNIWYHSVLTLKQCLVISSWQFSYYLFFTEKNIIEKIITLLATQTFQNNMKIPSIIFPTYFMSFIILSRVNFVWKGRTFAPFKLQRLSLHGPSRKLVVIYTLVSLFTKFVRSVNLLLNMPWTVFRD